MDDLNNRQIILLTMLVSFVVSTATGIMTVAMLEEAPPAITQTVNRVVERTIERVVTGTSTTPNPVPAPPVTTITKEVTIYAKEDDLIVTAVEKNQPRLARIYSQGSATSSSPDMIGVIISRDGMVALAARTLPTESKKSFSVLVGEKAYTGTLIANERMSDEDVALLRLNLDEGEMLNSITFGASGLPKIAQTVILLGGQDAEGISRGTVARLNMTKPASTSTPSTLATFDVSPKIAPQYAGGLALNLDGQAIGLIVALAGERIAIYPAERILKLISVVTDDAKQSLQEASEGTQTAAVGVSGQ